jgi:hypothetical protein
MPPICRFASAHVNLFLKLWFKNKKARAKDKRLMVMRLFSSRFPSKRLAFIFVYKQKRDFVYFAH